MNRILMTGTALLTLMATGMPAHAARKHATHFRAVSVQQWFGSGARVEGVDPNSAAERAGLRAGDLIVGINGTRSIINPRSIPSWRQAAGVRSRSM